MKEGGTLSSRDRYRLGIIGAFVGLTFLLLPVRGDGSVEGLAEQRTSPPVLTCSEAPAKSVGQVAYATGKTTGASGARQGQELQAQSSDPCGNKYNQCTNTCGNRHSYCMQEAIGESDYSARSQACDAQQNACNENCHKRWQACLAAIYGG